MVQAQVEFLGDGLSHNLLASLAQVEFLVEVLQDTHAMVTSLREQAILAQLVQVAMAVLEQLIIGEFQVVLQTMLALAQAVEVVLALMVAMAFQVVVVQIITLLVLEQTLVATVVQDLQVAVVDLQPLLQEHAQAVMAVMELV
jgi:hypothetical protein